MTVTFAHANVYERRVEFFRLPEYTPNADGIRTLRKSKRGPETTLPPLD